MGLAPDPADALPHSGADRAAKAWQSTALDAAADGNFGGRGHSPENRRAGYGAVWYEGREYSKLEWLLRSARRGDCLAWGDAAKVCQYYEERIEALERQLDVYRNGQPIDI